MKFLTEKNKLEKKLNAEFNQKGDNFLLPFMNFN